MIDKPIISRRFVRIKAIQNLYAFYINQQANYQEALENIKIGFLPDIFAIVPISEEKLLEERLEATNLFIAWEAKKQFHIPIQSHVNSLVNETLKKTENNYKFHLATNLKNLEAGWQVGMDKIRDTYLLILQLVIDWFVLAQEQIKNSTSTQKLVLNYPIALVHDDLLQRLCTDTTFIELINQYNISWSAHIELVIRWYNQFIKKNPILILKSLPDIPERRMDILKYLLEEIILNEKDTQNFFNESDISWIEHRPIIKRLLHQLITSVDILSFKSTMEDTIQIGANLSSFYNMLIGTIVEKEQDIEKLIQNHIRNWSMDRTVFIDKIIIKLAICEMQYFDNMPAKVVINEYVELAKKYSTPKSSLFINGVLDTIAKKI